ncbi:MAG: DUF2437 domain-containing protein, partial [Candidatus Altiarchaeales archaeon]|nr:DUF2437 domain-containing protein [Candidatus Altiarchaeales archaeon]
MRLARFLYEGVVKTGVVLDDSVSVLSSGSLE